MRKPSRRDVLVALCQAGIACSQCTDKAIAGASSPTDRVLVQDIASFFTFAVAGGLSDLAPGQIIESRIEGAQWQVLDPAITSADVEISGRKLAVLPNQNTLHLASFGVDGSASAKDFAAWRAATRAALRSAARLVGQPGAVYHFDPFANGTLAVVPMSNQSFWLDMQGAVLKFADRLSPPPESRFFSHQLLVVMRRSMGASNQSARLVRLENIVTDGNLRQQSDKRIGTTTAEQMAHLKVMCVAKDGNSLEKLEVRNFRSIDPVADCLLIGPSENATRPDGRAAIAHADLENLHAGSRNSVRAFVALGSGVNATTMRNVTCDPLTTAEGNSIETEFSAMGRQKVSLDISDCDIDDIEIGGRRNREEQLQVNVKRCTTRRFALFVFCDVTARDCAFRIGVPNSWQVRQASFENVTFQHATYVASGRSDVRPLSLHSTASGPHQVVFKGCRHHIDGEAPATTQNALIRFGSDIVANLGLKRARIESAWFDPRTAISVSNRGGWAVTTSECRFAGRKAGVVCGNFRSGAESYAGHWESRNDDFSAVTGLPFEITAAPGLPPACHLHGGTWPTLSFGFNGRNCEGVAQAQGRNLTLPELPRHPGGLVGDQIWRDEAPGRPPPRGAPLRWVCVRCGPGGNARNAAEYRVIARA